MIKLKDCYDRIKTILRDDTEPFESVALVEKYRQYWKPEKTKIILLAESHVFTTQDDTKIPIPEIDALPGYLKEYAKFVYCLGYGEPELTNSSSHPKRDGTWQFWKILYSCNNYVQSNEDFKPILKTTAFNERLLNKINLLKSLKQKGIWLVDASIIALYKDGKKPTEIKEVIKTSWECYTKAVVEGANPEYIICIGKGVYDVLEADLKQFFSNCFDWIFQPNARISSEEHMINYKKCGDICRHGKYKDPIKFRR